MGNLLKQHEKIGKTQKKIHKEGTWEAALWMLGRPRSQSRSQPWHGSWHYTTIKTYICICMCMHAYTCMKIRGSAICGSALCTHTCVYMHACMHVYICMYVYIHACIQIHAYICGHLWTRGVQLSMYRYIHTYKYIHIQINIKIHWYRKNTCMHACIHAYMHTYIHT
jgi:hypothetical protein